MAIAWTQQVYSSSVSTVAYDPENKEMFVTFQNNGARYVYSNVPEELAQQLANAPSVGSMLRSEIIPYYQGRRA